MRDHNWLLSVLNKGFAWGFVVAFPLGALLFVALASDPFQPIAFNHRKHVDAGMECTDCHSGAREQVRATLPDLSACLMCHENPVSDSPEEAKIRQAAQNGGSLAWQRIQRLPAHVYFSHRRHVTLAGLECALCHGPMQTLTQPPSRPFTAMTMEVCLGCHEKERARNDCNECHR